MPNRQLNSASRLTSQVTGQPAEFGTGMALGHISAALDRIVYIGEMHGNTLQGIALAQQQMAATQAALADTVAALAERPQQSCPHPTNPTKPTTTPLSFQEKAQLAVFALALAGALSGGMTLKEVLSVIGKPFGF